MEKKQVVILLIPFAKTSSIWMADKHVKDHKEARFLK
jgi:hypothetical protein